MHTTFNLVEAKMAGQVDASGYQHTDSKSEVYGQFLGLPLDADNEGDQTQERVDNWVTQLRKEGMPFRGEREPASRAIVCQVHS